MKLLERQQNYFNKICTIEDNDNVSNKYYESNVDAELGIEDKQVRIYVSSLARAKNWTTSLEKSRKY